MEDIPFSEELRSFPEELRRRDVPFMIVGAVGAVLQGAGLVTADINLWIPNLSDPRLQDAAKAVGGFYLAPQFNLPPTPPMLVGSAVHSFDLVTHMSGLGTFAEEYPRVLWIPFGGGVLPVLPLDRIIASKRAANREKDRISLPILEEMEKLLRDVGTGENEAT